MDNDDRAKCRAAKSRFLILSDVGIAFCDCEIKWRFKWQLIDLNPNTKWREQFEKEMRILKKDERPFAAVMVEIMCSYFFGCDCKVLEKNSLAPVQEYLENKDG